MKRPLPRFAALIGTSTLALLIGALACPAAAQEANHSHDEGPAHVPAHDGAVEDGIVVVGHPPMDYGLLAATASIGGDELVASTRAQIGDILNKLPGVSSTSFSPGASRPVLRGFSGDRISVLTDGIGSLDASSVSVDHAVVFDALTVDHIDVFHGPSVLIFGGNAIGGAVNALDKRIPRTVPDRITATGIGSYGSAADERALSGAIDIPLGERFVAHVDASWRKSDDLRVGGHVYSAALRQEMLDAAEHRSEEGETEEAAEIALESQRSGRLPNSAARTAIFGTGIAFIDAGGSLGISYQRYDTRYGVPGRPETVHEEGGDGHDHGEGPVTIGLVQDRVDLRGELKLSGVFDSLQLRSAFADYRHTEFEGDEIGTTFSGTGIETRADLVQRERGGWRGRSGVQYLTRELTVVGPEAVVPDYAVDRIGVFTLQSLDAGAGISLEASGRYDTSKVHSRGANFARQFDLWSAATGISWRAQSGFSVGVNYVHGERAPSPEELLSDGVHVATQAYEVGDQALGKERSDSFEAYARYTSGPVNLALTGYLTNFANFITPLATGDFEDGQPVYRYTGVKARFKGFEASASFEAATWNDGGLKFDVAADYTRASLKGIGPAPRIPPLRLRGGTDVTFGALHLRGEVEWNARQKRVGPFENPTKAFTLVNLSTDWHPLGEDGPVTLILSADNLLDVSGRRSTSYTSDFVPISGRDVRLTAKISY